MRMLRVGFGFSAMTIIAVAIAGVLGFAAARLAAGQAAMTADRYVAQAKIAAGTDWSGTLVRLCIPEPPPAQPAGAETRRIPDRATWYAEPAKVADNLYFIGTKIHSSWAIVGSQGIIIIEALYDYAAQDEILGGLKKLGLDQSKVKYVILSHAHADHDGGAKLLQDSIPGAHLIYGAEDWKAVDASTNHAGGKPKHDLVGTDGMKVSVGDASVEMVTMPGHTPGTLSYLFEVRDNGKPLKIAYVGGTAIPFNGSPEFYDTYIASSQKMGRAAESFGATALLTNHSEFDDAYLKAHTAAGRRAGEANPFDVGADAVKRYFEVVQDCAEATRLRAAGK